MHRLCLIISGVRLYSSSEVHGGRRKQLWKSSRTLELVACRHDGEFVGTLGCRGARFALDQKSAGAALDRKSYGVVSFSKIWKGKV